MERAWKKIKKNQKLRENFFLRAEILKAIRDFFDKEGFLEVETPTLVSAPDPSIFNEVFKIEGENLYLTPSPEFCLKKLLVAGFKNIYQITKAYRDWQEKDPLHLNEFTILEWYRTGADYQDLMKDCENLILFISERIKKNYQKLIYQEREIDLSLPWKKISCKQAFAELAGIDLRKFLDFEEAKRICLEKGYEVYPETSWEELYHQVFLNEVEPKLPKEKPFFLYDYPAPLAALAQVKKDDPAWAERFEFYIGGLELGNGYSELTDAKEQEKRLKQDLRERKKRGMKTFEYDKDFVEALKEGMPKTAGIAVGVDRLVMLFANAKDIREVAPMAS